MLKPKTLNEVLKIGWVPLLSSWTQLPCHQIPACSRSEWLFYVPAKYEADQMQTTVSNLFNSTRVFILSSTITFVGIIFEKLFQVVKYPIHSLIGTLWLNTVGKWMFTLYIQSQSLDYYGHWMSFCYYCGKKIHCLFAILTRWFDESIFESLWKFDFENN